MPTTPGEETTVEVALPGGTWQVPAGSRLRVLVTSTDQTYAAPRTARADLVQVSDLRLPSVDGAAVLATDGGGLDDEVVGLLVAIGVVGLVSYGPAGFSNPSGGTLDWTTFGPRLVVVAAYLVVTLLPVGAIAFALGVRTDAPLAAVGGAVMVTIVAAILHQIDDLGSLRNALPLHDAGAWFSLLRPEVVWDDLVQGTLWSVLYTLVFVGLAFWMFRRKDVLS